MAMERQTNDKRFQNERKRAEIRRLTSLCQEDRELYETLESLKPGNKLALFGAGVHGKDAVDLLRSNGRHVDWFIDNSPQKIGTKIKEIPVVSPDFLFDEAHRTDVLLTSNYLTEFIEQLYDTPLFHSIRGALLPYFFEQQYVLKTHRPFFDFKSYSDLSRDIREHQHRLPNDIDLIVGITKSGLIPAMMIGFNLNISTTDLDSFVDGRIFSNGIRRAHRHQKNDLNDCRKILVVDDSLGTGVSLDLARQRITESGMDRNREILYYVVYSGNLDVPVDFYCKEVRDPVGFEWNWTNSPFLSKSCVDIDGVLCRDPDDWQIDDGEHYLRFLEETRPIYIPRFPIQMLVTNRLEKYRKWTEAWLDKHEIRYNSLVMSDLPSEAARKKQPGNPGQFKADVYKRTNAVVFVESSHEQAVFIARESGKPVLSVEKQRAINPF